MAAVPFFAPGLIIWSAIALVISPSVGRFLRTSRLHAVLLILALGLIVMATLTPTGAALTGTGSQWDACDLTRIGVAPLSVLLHLNDKSLNVALFVPLGLALGSLPLLAPERSRSRRCAAPASCRRAPPARVPGAGTEVRKRRRDRQHDGSHHRPGDRLGRGAGCSLDHVALDNREPHPVQFWHSHPESANQAARRVGPPGIPGAGPRREQTTSRRDPRWRLPLRPSFALSAIASSSSPLPVKR